MTIRKNSFSLITAVALCGAAVLSPKPLSSQEDMGGFMFHPPKVTLSLNFGYGIPTAGSDLFQDIDKLFTLDNNDFHAVVIGGGLSFFLNERMDVALESSYSNSSTWSEYEDFVDGDDLPIEQETQFTQVPLTVSLRYFLMDRGRQIGNLSWIPTTWSPYIGAGGGGMWYEFQQVGDFIDFDDMSVYWDGLHSDGWSWVGHVFGGLQWAFSPQWVVTAEARYTMGSAELDRPAYSGYEPIDLSGFQGSLGFGVRW